MSEESSPKLKNDFQDFSLISGKLKTKSTQEINSKKRKIPEGINIEELGGASKKIKDSTTKGVKCVPEEQSNPWGMLLGLYYWQTTTEKKYAAKKEIKDSFVKVAQVRSKI